MELIIKILGGILTAVIVGHFISKAESVETYGKLHFGKFTLVLSVCCFVFSAFMLWVWIYVNHGGQDIPIALLFICFSTGSIYTFFECFYTKGSYDKNGLNFKSPWQGSRIYSWKDLLYIDFNDILNWYILEFNDGKKIRISSYMHGQNGLFKLLEEFDEKNT